MVSDALTELVIDRTRRLAAIPAPPLQEHDRAVVVEEWWSSDLDHVSIDDVGNVWGRVRAGRGPAVLVAAHLDTVFGVEDPHGTEQRDGRLYGPSVGDDSVAVAALATLADLLPADPGGPVWILGTVGEEGLGNLTGIRHALSRSPVGIGALVALEGNWLGRVCLTGVGSIRRRVALGGQGGHAWEASHVDSAVHGVARIIAAIDGSPRPAGARSAVNVGLVGGGSAINTRADHAWFDVDLRADTPEALAELTATLEVCVQEHARGLSIVSESLGERPAGGLDANHPLARSATTCLAAAGIEAELTAASTDANAAHAVGIPAIAIGVTHGENEHTLDEWIELAPLPTGLRILANTITDYLRSTR